jgi:hypothetical protein
LTKIKPPGGTGANLLAMMCLTSLQLYIAQNVFGRCGHAVTRLVEAGQPVLQFCELYPWGRTQARDVPLKDDPALASAARPAAPPAPTG